MIIRTPSFELAVTTRGDENAVRMAFVLPGLLDTKDYQHVVTLQEALAAKGFFAVSLDAPGTWESGGDISVYSLQSYEKAVQELHEHFGKKPVVFAGHSFGGFLSLKLGASAPETLAIVDIMGVSRYVAEAENDELTDTWKREGIRRGRRDLPQNPNNFMNYVLPYSFHIARAGADTRGALALSDVPKLFIAGKDDTTVPSEQVLDGYNACREPRKFVEVPGDHDYRKDPVRIQQVNDLVVAFIQESVHGL
jgi:pimeloyl-ACP methyl ester carboxylesterase